MSYELDLIAKKYKITDFLKERGINCASHDGDKYRYHCPLPSHKNDKTPSFFIYDKNNKQDFYCYGCKHAGGIVQFVSAYEQISFKESLQKLLQGFDIKIDDVIDHLLKELIIYNDDDAQNEKKDLLIADSLYIANHMYSFLQKVNFNTDDLRRAEHVFEIADNLVYIENDKDLRKLAENLPRNTKKRYQEYIAQMKAENIAKIKATLNDGQNKI